VFDTEFGFALVQVFDLAVNDTAVHSVLQTKGANNVPPRQSPNESNSINRLGVLLPLRVGQNDNVFQFIYSAHTHLQNNPNPILPAEF
jgi:hypothetical protein